MRKRKVFLKADASSEIGYGHFIRTLALADMLKDEFDCTFFTANPNEFQCKEVEKVCSLHPLDFEDAIPAFLNLLTGEEIVVLDNYYYTENYQRQIKQKGCPLVCIDDIHDKHFYADMVINHTPCINPAAYSCEPYTRLLLGTDYLLLRRPFFDAINILSKRNAGEVFVCFGGSDEYNMTLQACKVIRQIDNRAITVVVGGGYTFRDELAQYAADSNIRIFSNVDAMTMIMLMKQAELAIIPASCTFFETCCARIPIITGYTVHNQYLVAAGCEKLGLGYNCGNLLEDFDEKMKIALDEVRLKGNLYVNQQSVLIKDSKSTLINKFKSL